MAEGGSLKGRPLGAGKGGEGRHDDTDPQETHMDFYEEAAAEGLPGAQFNLGLLYENGWFVDQSDSMAIRYYHMAAAQGDDVGCERSERRVRRDPFE